MSRGEIRRGQVLSAGADMEVRCALATRFSDEDENEDEDAAGAPSAAATAFASCVRSTYASYIRIHIEPAGRHCSEVLKEIEIEFPQVANSSMRSVGHLDHLLDLHLLSSCIPRSTPASTATKRSSCENFDCL